MAIVARKNKNGTMTYQVKVQDPEGKWYPMPGFQHLDEAKKEEARLIELKRKGARTFSDDAKRVTLDEYWYVWSKENRAEVSDGWKISQDQMYRDYVKPVLGEMKMIQIKAPEIGRALNRAQELGLSEQTRKHIYSLMRKMFTDAVEYYEMLAVNPVKPKFHRPRVKKIVRNFLLPAQAWQLLEEAKKSYLGPPVWLQILSALRVEAAIALDWECVQWELNQILICRAWKQKVKKIVDYPKGKDWEFVPMPPALKEYLKEIWIGRGSPQNGFVCLSLKGERLSYNTYLHAIERLCKKAGVLVLTTHELRHTCTEIYVNAGASAEDIRRLLNHASLTATARYIHRTDERLTKIAGLVGHESSFPKSFPNGKKEAVCMEKKGVDSVH